MPKKQQKKKSLSSFYFPFLQPGDAIIGFLESAVALVQRFCDCPAQWTLRISTPDCPLKKTLLLANSLWSPKHHQALREP